MRTKPDDDIFDTAASLPIGFRRHRGREPPEWALHLPAQNAVGRHQRTPLKPPTIVCPSALDPRAPRPPSILFRREPCTQVASACAAANLPTAESSARSRQSGDDPKAAPR